MREKLNRFLALFVLCGLAINGMGMTVAANDDYSAAFEMEQIVPFADNQSTALDSFTFSTGELNSNTLSTQTNRLTLAADEESLTINIVSSQKGTYRPTITITVGNEIITNAQTEYLSGKISSGPINVEPGELKTIKVRVTAYKTSIWKEYPIDVYRTETTADWKWDGTFSQIGDSQVLKLSLHINNNPTLSSFRFALGFDPTKLQLCNKATGITSATASQITELAAGFSSFFDQPFSSTINNTTGSLKLEYGRLQSIPVSTYYTVNSAVPTLTVHFKVLNDSFDENTLKLITSNDSRYSSASDSHCGFSLDERTAAGTSFISSSSKIISIEQPMFTIATIVSPAQSGTVKIVPGKEQYFYGETITLTATPAKYYGFTGWSGVDISQENETSYKITKNSDITANFLMEQARVTLDAYSTDGGDGGSVTINVGEGTEHLINKGTPLIIRAVTNDGYRFDGWCVNGESTPSVHSEVIFPILEDDISYTAQFYKLKEMSGDDLRGLLSGGEPEFEDSGAMFIRVPGGTLKLELASGRSAKDIEKIFEDEVIILTAIPDSGNIFSGWRTGNTQISALTTENEQQTPRVLSYETRFETTLDANILSYEALMGPQLTGLEMVRSTDATSSGFADRNLLQRVLNDGSYITAEEAEWWEAGFDPNVMEYDLYLLSSDESVVMNVKSAPGITAEFSYDGTITPDTPVGTFQGERVTVSDIPQGSSTLTVSVANENDGATSEYIIHVHKSISPEEDPQIQLYFSSLMDTSEYDYALEMRLSNTAMNSAQFSLAIPKGALELYTGAANGLIYLDDARFALRVVELVHGETDEEFDYLRVFVLQTGSSPVLVAEPETMLKLALKKTSLAPANFKPADVIIVDNTEGENHIDDNRYFSVENDCTKLFFEGATVEGIFRAYKALDAAVITLESDSDQIIKEVFAEPNGFGLHDYEVKFVGLQEGSYTLTIAKPGHCDFVFTFNISESDVTGRTEIDLNAEFAKIFASSDNGEIVLICGDLDGDSRVRLNDRNLLMNSLYYGKKVENFDPSMHDKAYLFDLNGDGYINAQDLMIMTSHSNFGGEAVTISIA